MTIEQSLQKAIAYHQAGQLQDAERLYRAILQAQQNQPDANHNLGVLAVQMKQPAAGLPHFKAALEANPNQGQYWLSYIDALIQIGQTDAARHMLGQGMQRGLQGVAVEALAGRLTSGAQLAMQSNERCQHAFEEPLSVSAASQNSKKKSKHHHELDNSGRASGAHKGKIPSPQEIKTLVALFTDGQYTEAASLAQTMTVCYPLHGFGWKVLGAVFRQMGQAADALAPMQKAAVLSPCDAEAHSNLGAFLHDLGRLNEAEASFRRAIQIKPGFAEAHYNLGNLLNDLGQPDGAEASLRRALQIKPDYADVLNNLALLFNAQGKFIMALAAIQKSLQIKGTREAKGVFVACVKRLRITQDDSNIRAYIVRALTEPWGRPSELARTCAGFVKLNSDIGGCVTRAVNAWPRRLPAQELFGANGRAALVSDPLLPALLDAVPVCDIEMERLLTMARHELLEAAMTASGDEADDALSFYSALARQCFINEYVFSHADDEIRKATDLRDALVAALQADAQIPTLWPVAVAAYFPLCSLPFAARLLERQWPEEVTAVLKQQVSEPAQELQLRATIPRLTSIEDEVSLLVQNQYEENPYPRWVRAAPFVKSKRIIGYLGEKFPLSPFNRCGKCDTADILIAGCGTGQHSIDVAQQFKGAQVLAVDLSLSSLSYAKRKTRELGLTSIEYAQADLLRLGSLGRSFDVIESAGVLHHLADPWAGWQLLLSLLRPGGFMKLGFYSEVARRNIVRARAFIAEQGYAPTTEDIRRCRQDLMDLDKSADFGTTLKSSDFFSLSECRDLLFHVQEHRMTLTVIDAFLRENNLAFLWFEIEPHVLHAYKLRFPDDHAAMNLAQWQIFENENPDIFLSMYQFWIQKAG